MKAGTLSVGRRASSFAALVFLLLLTGCASLNTNWPARVGTYTFDDAVLEFGPPNKSAPLSDGTQVAEWVTQYRYTRTYSPYTYAGSAYASEYMLPYGPLAGEAYVHSSPGTVLRLAFDPDGKLQSWKILLQ